MAGLARTLLGAPLRCLLPPDPTVQAPFVPGIVVVAGFAAYVYVYRDGPDGRRRVTGPGSEGRDR